MGGSYQQEVDLLSLFKDVASEYVQMVTVPEQLPNVLDRAIRIALAERAPTALIIPADVQELEYSAPGARVQDGALVSRHRLAGRRPARRRRSRGPPRSSTPGARSPSWPGRAPAARGASSRRSPSCSAPAWPRPLLGKDVLSDELPYVTGAIGLLGTRPSYELMMNCDTLLTVGSNFPYTQFLPEFGQARGVQIDIDGKFIGMRYPYEVNLVGDAAATLRALIPHLKRKEDRSWREGIEAGVARWWRVHGRRGRCRGRPGQPDAAVPRAVRPAARRTPSSPPTPARPRTGTPAS